MATPIKVDKEKKYDRQLRLWGDHGQAALEAASVCLINVTATGTEILKNLILPGIGSFTIVDGHKVTGQDVGNNFFLEKDSIGKSRAKAAAELLQELNSDVKGDFIEETPEQLLENNPHFFHAFSIVIATHLQERTLTDLASNLWEAEVPLLVSHSYGLCGYMRLAIKEHTVIESHPDNTHEDLRLDCPFPALIKYIDSMNFDTMTKQEHSHTPYLVILLKCLNTWKQQHSGQFPKNYKEKEAFKRVVREGIRKNEEGLPEEEENFDEAIKNVNNSLVLTRVPSEVMQILNHDKCLHITAESSPFWIMANALKQFVDCEGAGLLPLRGSIPDMLADSKRYIQLQNVYRLRAQQDTSAVNAKVQQTLGSLGLAQDMVTEADVKAFCRNAYFLRVLRYRSLEQEYNTETANVTDIAMHLENPNSELVWYVLLRAVSRFYSQYSRHPGQYVDQVETDIPKLKNCLNNIVQEWGLTNTIKDDYIHEMCRFGGSELHSVAAFLGGAAAQEVIKIVTHQFVPFNNTYIYNAMASTSATFQL